MTEREAVTLFDKPDSRYLAMVSIEKKWQQKMDENEQEVQQEAGADVAKIPESSQTRPARPQTGMEPSQARSSLSMEL